MVYGVDGSVPSGQPIVSFRKPNYAYVWEHSQGAHMAIDPRKNNGIGTWGEIDFVKAMEWIELPTKHGVLAFMSLGTNHTLGNVLSCDHAHTFYETGGSPCDHGCVAVYQNQGPTYTHMEPAWVVFDPVTLLKVKAGTQTDYTVDPSSWIWPKETWPVMNFLEAGFDPHTEDRTGGSYYDPDTHNLYLSLVGSDVASSPGSFQDLIYVFHIKG
jgi:hypothetical protein